MTIDLSKEFHPVPKPAGKVKMPKKINQVGKKTKAWNDVRAELKERFFKVGIVKCEIRGKDCFKDNFLGFAHLEKRVKLEEGDLYKVVLACQKCHNWAEFESTGGFMKALFLGIIKDRKKQP